MKRVIRLNERDLTKIVRRVIQEQKVNESNRMRNAALTLGLTVSVLLPSCGLNDEKEIKKFETELQEINDFTPEKKIEGIHNMMDTSDLYRQLWSTESGYNSMLSAIYRVDAEKHLDLCAKMIAFQLDKCGEGKEIKVDVKKYVDKILGGDLDKVDSMILQSFQQGVESKQKELEYSENAY